jgi:hypothetical protein
MSDTPAENQTAPIVDENQLIAEKLKKRAKALRFPMTSNQKTVQQV